MRIGPTEILDTHAEAFAAWFARLVVTAVDASWLDAALRSATGYGTSVIGCDAEVGVERMLRPDESPDGRPAAAVLLFAFTKDKLADAVGNRVGQCVLTCPTTACYNGLSDAAETVPLGDCLRYFGDGFESQERNDWRIPVMDGEFAVDATAGLAKGVAGGNLILQGMSQDAALAAASKAAAAVAPLRGVITPFPGGVCRAGSKVGGQYEGLIASTNAAYCPTLRDRAPSQLVNGATCAYEIVVNGVDQPTVAAAMRTAIEAAAGEGVLAIGAGDYGGNLGKIRIRLHEIFAAS